MLSYVCAFCQSLREKPTGEVNRARKINAPLYCDRTCSGMGRRKGKTKAQKIAEKRAYDAAYRVRNFTALKVKKAAWFQATYNPEKAAIERKTRMPRHVEYCRHPEYKAWKREYDRRLRAGEYGEFSEAFLLLQDLERELDARASWYERANQKGTINKTMKRKRAYEQSVSHQS